MKPINKIVLIIFGGIIIAIALFYLFSNTSIQLIGEKIPEFKEMISSTIQYNISANLEMELGKSGEGTFSIRNCSFLYLTNNVSVLKCADGYIRKEGNNVISCEKSQGDWYCRYWLTSTGYMDIIDFREFLTYLLENINYTVVGKAINKINERYAYCYNVTASKSENSTIGVLNIAMCFDKQTRVPIFGKITIIFVEKGIEQRSYIKWNLSNLVVNPRYDDYKELLVPPTWL